MKRTFFIAALTFLSLSFSGVVNAQKIGHLNFQSIIQAMPEYKTASDEYELYKQSLEDDLKMMEAEAVRINKSYELEAKKPAPSQTRLKLYAQQIESIQMDYQEMQQSIQDSLTAKMNELVAPIKDKVELAVEAVAKEKGYTHIIDNSYGTLLYADEAYNIEADVKAKLNIKEVKTLNPGAGKPGGVGSPR